MVIFVHESIPAFLILCTIVSFPLIILFYRLSILFLVHKRKENITMKKCMKSLVVLMIPFGISVSAMTYGFSGGVTGHLWSGQVWAQWMSRNDPKINNQVVVYASGKNTTKAYATRWSNAYTSTNRKPSGNKSYWGYY